MNLLFEIAWTHVTTRIRQTLVGIQMQQGQVDDLFRRAPMAECRDEWFATSRCIAGQFPSPPIGPFPIRLPDGMYQLGRLSRNSEPRGYTGTARSQSRRKHTTKSGRQSHIRVSRWMMPRHCATVRRISLARTSGPSPAASKPSRENRFSSSGSCIASPTAAASLETIGAGVPAERRA